MLQTSEASKGLVFGSFLFRSDLFTEKKLITHWEQEFGNSFFYRPEVNPLNTYYAKEMAGPLSRFFVLSTQTFDRDHLLSSKLKALEWEKTWAQEGKRTVNVDTGILTLENFLLATTKNYSHRVYIGQNLFADLTYYFHQGELQTFPWTYPDYLDLQKKEFFLLARSYLLGFLNR